MILDKLIEKKDLLIYIDCRIKILKRTRERVLNKTLDRKKALVAERFNGRILELEMLKGNIDTVKDKAKKYWNYA